ncbi:MAG: OmpA family protein [Pseudomonadota bacterium]
MSPTRLIPALATAILLAAISTAANAQDEGEQSVEEMAENFLKQKTRSLVIATPGAAAPTDEVDDGTTTPPVEITATAVPAAENAGTVIPKDEQVNVNVSFDFDSAALREDQKPKLVRLCTALKAADVQMIRILGHTDSSGSADYNERLSKLRAEEVKRFLASDCGYPVDRMEALGVGERFPFDPEDPKADVNRRVEFQALG